MRSDCEQFQLGGFVKVPALFSPDEAADMRANVARYLQDVAPNLPGGAAITVDDGHVENDSGRYVFLARMDLYDSLQTCGLYGPSAWCIGKPRLKKGEFLKLCEDSTEEWCFDVYRKPEDGGESEYVRPLE